MFYSDEFETVVTPTGGTYRAQWSANGVYFVDFEGIQFPVNADTVIEDWQATGYIDTIKITPIDITGATHWKVKYRAHRFGMPGVPARAITSNPYFAAVSTVNVSAYELSVLQGNAISTGFNITVPANTTYSVDLVRNCDTVITQASADGLFISFNDGVASGSLIGVSTGLRLNTLQDFRFQVSFEYRDGLGTGDRPYSRLSDVDVFYILNGGGCIELTNETSNDISTFFSCGQVALSAPIVPFMLLPDTLLEPNTEMGDYNGAN